MDEQEAAKLDFMRMLQEHSDAAGVFADEAAALARVAEQDGNAAFAAALWALARSHRASRIKYQAQLEALRVEGLPNDGAL